MTVLIAHLDLFTELLISFNNHTTFVLAFKMHLKLTKLVFFVQIVPIIMDSLVLSAYLVKHVILEVVYHAIKI